MSLPPSINTLGDAWLVWSGEKKIGHFGNGSAWFGITPSYMLGKVRHSLHVWIRPKAAFAI